NTEDRLQTARRYYNSNVREYNRRVQSFPSKLIADGFGFKEEQFFEVDESLRGDAGVPHVDFGGDAPGGTFGDGSAPAAPAPAASAPSEPAAPAEEPPPPPPTPGT